MWLRLLLFGSFVCSLSFAPRACPVKAIGFPFHLRDGDDGIRTHDPLLAGQVLSQLSYTPMSVTHRPLTLFFCFYNEQGMNLVHNRLPFGKFLIYEGFSSACRFSLDPGFPSCKHDSLKIEQQHS